jgi:hypothetical protein
MLHSSVRRAARRAAITVATRAFARPGAAVLIALFALFTTTVAGAQTFTHQVLSGLNQTTEVGTLFPERFSVRITDATNAPIAGMRVQFQINLVLCFPLPPPAVCPPPAALYGTFVSPGAPSLVEVLTDANGVATTPPYRAGTLAGEYELFAYVGPQTVNGIPYPGGNILSLFALSQQNVRIPALGTTGMIMLVVAFTAIAAHAIRRRRNVIASRR